MNAILSLLPYVPIFLVVISLVITVHELGHYWVGRMFGAAAESFSIGFGKPIVERRDKRGTRWRINWIPLGGFVKFVGEVQIAHDVYQTQEAVVGDEKTAAAVNASAGANKIRPVLVGKPYTALGPWKRIAVSLGGPLANFVFAVFVFAIMGFSLGVPQAQEVFVNSVRVGSAAEIAGFKPGDVILEAGGRPVHTGNDVVTATQLNAGEGVNYRVRRGEAVLALTATPVETEVANDALKVKQKVGQVGIGLGERDTQIRGLNPVEAVGYGVNRVGSALGDTLNVMRRLVMGKEGIDKLSGPVGILQLTGGVTEMTLSQEGVSLGDKIGQLLLTLLHLSALLSVGIGFFNLLPIPVLDGGAIVMTLAEAVTGKPLPDRVQEVGLTIGLVCLVTFALVVTLQDSIRLPWGS